jgi:hypothetical protein
MRGHDANRTPVLFHEELWSLPIARDSWQHGLGTAKLSCFTRPFLGFAKFREPAAPSHKFNQALVSEPTQVLEVDVALHRVPVIPQGYFRTDTLYFQLYV